MDSVESVHSKSKKMYYEAQPQLFPASTSSRSKSIMNNADTNDATAAIAAAITTETAENKFQRKVQLLNSIYRINDDIFVKVGLDLYNRFKLI